ncbi:MAG TPA: hypothetical protein VGP07_08550 [Polyangia bacterium]|nr:hypothetical protein [Kofleriaceae bacterium]
MAPYSRADLGQDVPAVGELHRPPRFVGAPGPSIWSSAQFAVVA